MSASRVLDKDVKKLARRLEKQYGFAFEEGRRGHFTVLFPDGSHAGTLSSSPGTPRWELAGLRSLERKWVNR